VLFLRKRSFTWGLSLAVVSVEDVRDVLHVTDADIPDVKVLKMIKRAEVTVELETSAEIDYLNCTDAQKEAITVLAALYALCFLTGGSAVGLNFSVGDLNVNNQAASSLPQLSVLQGECERLINGLKTFFVRSA
jgi:hypothetical protein